MRQLNSTDMAGKITWMYVMVENAMPCVFVKDLGNYERQYLALNAPRIIINSAATVATRLLLSGNTISLT